MKSDSWYKNHAASWLLIIALLFTGSKSFAQPTAAFTGSDLSGCAPILVHFTDQSSGNPNYWKWDLGNGTISYLQHPSVTYINPGTYTIKLTVKNSSGEDSLIKTAYVTVYAAPVVNFTASQTSSCAPVNVSFTNLSNSGNHWQWDFGDGIFSTDENPSHAYTQNGIYNVSLKVINTNSCAATLVKQAYIRIQSVKAEFSHSVPAICNPARISYKAQCTGAGNMQYHWDFGNGDTSSSANPVYNYAAGGNYRVSLTVSNEYGCTDSIQKNVTVENPVNAAFTVSATKFCSIPASVQFTSTPKPGNTYYWVFGDTTWSRAANPTHVYTDTGSYTVKLIVRNTNGCTDSSVRTGLINIQKPFVMLENLPDSGCVPFTKKLSFVSTGADEIVNYEWQFGDGQRSTAISPTHTYTSDGYFDVTLITTGLSGCTDTTVFANAIRAGIRPVAAFDADTRNVCAQAGVNFTDQSQGNVNQWLWDFGDNTQAVDQHPRHIFTDSGYINVALIAFNGGCSDTLIKRGYIYVKPAISKFRFNFGCADPYSFSFSNFSVGATSWQWDLGDNSTSTDLNPVHIYTDTGFYSVKLSTFNSNTGCSYTLTKKIRVEDIHPDFFADDPVACKGQTVKFTSTIETGVAGRFLWNFGDGIKESTLENNITHVYEQPGTYTVTLITINKVNCRDTVVKTAYVQVYGLKAEFAASSQLSCANTAVQFNDNSSTFGNNHITAWTWNYGDGVIQTVSAAPFSHTYHSGGNFIISLKVTDDKGCSDSTVTDVPVTVKKLNAWFMSYDTLKCTGADVKFTCPYAVTGINYRWDFGDGGTAVVQAPVHKYTQQGVYSVKLVLSLASGCSDSFMYNNYVRIEDPLAAFTMSDSIANCPPLIIHFNNQSQNIAEQTWDFGDGSSTSMATPSHFYSQSGTYIVKLTVKGRGGCSSVFQRRVIVKGPNGALHYSPLNYCAAPADIVLHASTRDAEFYIWDLNDGTTIQNTDSVMPHRYLNAGRFLPRLILADSNGCRVPVNGTDTIAVNEIKAQFEFTDKIYCSGEHVYFDDKSTSTERIVSYQWNFGDGYYASGMSSVSHDYQQAGTYYPSLIITTASGCSDTITSTDPVRIGVSPQIGISSIQNGCAPLTATFRGETTNPLTDISSWHWDFGNGNTAAEQNPAAQLFTQSGNYTITLTATSSSGCSKSVAKVLEAYPVPALSISGNKILCKGSNTILTAAGADSYQWTSTATVNCTNCTSVDVHPSADAVYKVKGTTANGCYSYDSVTVQVIQPTSITVDRVNPVCAGTAVSLSANGAVNYRWTPATGLNKNDIASPVANLQQTTTFAVTGTDDKGCFSDTAYITVTVNALPEINAGADKSITSGDITELVPVVSADVVAVNWSPTGAVFRNEPGYGISVKPATTTEYTAEARNAAGCTAADKLVVNVEAATGGLFIPNTFSPNGDGANDVFYPRASSSLRIMRFRIMNREGMPVFEKTNFNANDVSAGWNGTYRGSNLPSDIYVYVLELAGQDGKTKLITGNVSLIR